MCRTSLSDAGSELYSSERTEHSITMQRPDVAIVEMYVAPEMPTVTYWKIKRVAPGKHFLGWATEDGGFTPGMYPGPEGIHSMVFRTSVDAVEWAQQRGWNVISVMPRSSIGR
jgi:hypothetical protein